LIVASRLCRSAYAAFDGGGGLSRSGRWHEQGRRIVYAAESEALAALEVLAHLSSFTQFPDYVCVKARIPEKLILDVRDFGSLPADWASPEPEHARRLGTLWIESKTSAVLRVPSVVIPRESNFMINPEHPDFKSITVDLPLPFEFDVRLIHRLQ
jgi:RES domain-containing protein